MSWTDYVQRHRADDTNQRVAERIGVDPSTVGRWGRSEPRPGAVIAFAREYGRPPIEALIAAGLMTEQDAAQLVRVADLSEASIDELLGEIRARLERGEDRGKAAPIADLETARSRRTSDPSGRPTPIKKIAKRSPRSKGDDVGE